MKWTNWHSIAHARTTLQSEFTTILRIFFCLFHMLMFSHWIEEIGTEIGHSMWLIITITRFNYWTLELRYVYFVIYIYDFDIDRCCCVFFSVSISFIFFLFIYVSVDLLRKRIYECMYWWRKNSSSLMVICVRFFLWMFFFRTSILNANNSYFWSQR